MVAVKRMIKPRQKYNYTAYLWIAPAFILLLVFSYIPPISALLHSFTDWDGTNVPVFSGVANFVKLFNDAVFWVSVKNMLILLVVCMVVGNVATIVFAELLYNFKWSKMSAVMRFLFVVPILVPGIVSMLVWSKIIFIGQSTGLANQILGIFNIPPQQWYYGESSVLFAIIMTGFPWIAGTSFLIYLAGLQNIPDSVIEASKLDGCKAMRRIFAIDLPYLMGQIKYFVILGIIGGMQNFSIQFAVTNGGPFGIVDNIMTSSIVPAYYMYMLAYNNNKFGYACSIGAVMFIVILLVTIINNKFLKSSSEV